MSNKLKKHREAPTQTDISRFAAECLGGSVLLAHLSGTDVKVSLHMPLPNEVQAHVLERLNAIQALIAKCFDTSNPENDIMYQEARAAHEANERKASIN